jgi:hypothetical protein
MNFTGLGPRERREIEEALRRGEPLALQLDGELPRELRAEQVAPWFDAASARSPSLQDALRSFLPAPARPGAAPLKVSAVIPTNRGTPLGLAALRAQDVQMEVVVLQNGRCSGIVDGDRVYALDWRGHGATRQRGVELAKGDYILFTVDDALPRGPGVVRRLVEALEAGGYDAVYGRQVPWPTSDAITRDRLAAWTPSGREPHPSERLDHVFALARRDTLLRHPLPEVPTAEDLLWRQGKRIGYVPGAVVIHAHPRRPGELYRRTRDIHTQHILLGEAPRVPDAAALFAALPGVVAPALRGGPGEGVNQLAELLGQWRAAKISGSTGRDRGPGRGRSR